MFSESFRQRVETLLSYADVAINGERPWDLRVNHTDFFQRVLAQGSLAFGETYMEGWWESEALDQLLTRLIETRLDHKIKSLVAVFDGLKARILNCQSQRRAFTVGERHYDIGNDLYQMMLDKRMLYSCGYWKDATTLDQAQEAKLEISCRKLHLKAGQRVLDLGCGWGGTAAYLVENYGVEVVGVTISGAQAEMARNLCEGLPVEICLQDYRGLAGQYDRIVSIGMFEHVGPKNYGTFFRKVAALLKDDGLFLLHTIGGNTPAVRTDPWIERYIFPNGVIPSAQQITRSYEGQLVLEDWHSFGSDYDRTLMAWKENFEKGWPELSARYDERFYRMWNYYLSCSAASFRARDSQLWQIVLSKNGIPGGSYFPR